MLVSLEVRCSLCPYFDIELIHWIQQAGPVTMCWCTVTLHPWGSRRCRNYLITSAMSIKEPLAVYPSPPLSTVSKFLFSLPGSIYLTVILDFLDADVCDYRGSWNCANNASENRRSVTWRGSTTSTHLLTMGTATSHPLVPFPSMKLHGNGV